MDLSKLTDAELIKLAKIKPKFAEEVSKKTCGASSPESRVQDPNSAPTQDKKNIAYLLDIKKEYDAATPKTNVDISELTIEKTSSAIANELIIKNHYSHTVAKGVVLNLALKNGNKIVGIAQLGYGIMPKKTCQWVKETKSNEYFELNRLWVDDCEKRNAESYFISQSIKFVKINYPIIKWIISFADGMMGKVGTIYQATNWIYTGFRWDGGIWLTKEGKRMHSVSLWHKHGTINREVLEGVYGKPLKKIFGGQFRYFYFLNRKSRKLLTVPVLAYPKQEDLHLYIKVLDSYKIKKDKE
jgi:hypothetical protein